MKEQLRETGQRFQCALPLLSPVCNGCVVMKRKRETKVGIKIDAQIRAKIIRHGAILID